jgi:hypothetical protein
VTEVAVQKPQRPGTGDSPAVTAIRIGRRMRRTALVPVVLGAAVWLLLYRLRLGSVPTEWWFARDDAVITMSHAKNFADFGTIGVSPVDRVEGFSSPLQFVVAAVVFALSSGGYGLFSRLLLVGGVAAMGALTAAVVYVASRRFGNRHRRSVVIAVATTLFAALVTVASWTTSGWIASGMENPLVVVSGLAVLLFAVSESASVANRVGMVASLAMLGLARVELAPFVVPVAAALALVYAQKWNWQRPLLMVAWTAGAPLAVLAATHVARRLYFGTWLPNTALVQGRAQGRIQIVLLGALLGASLLALLHAFVTRLDRQRDLVVAVKAACIVLTASLLAVAAWLSLSGRSKGALGNLGNLPGLLVLLAAVLVLTRLAGLLDAPPWLPNSVFATLVSVPLMQYLVMGPARLEDFRVASIAIPFLAVWCGVAVARFVAVGWPSTAHRVPGHRQVRWALLPVGLLLLASLAWIKAHDPVRDLPFRIDGTEDILAVSDLVRTEQLGGGALPIMANPDLGKVSFPKRVVVVDLGLLGDPLMTHVAIDWPALMVTYLNEVAAPDVVESHMTWSCRYGGWLNSDAFRTGWVLSDDRWLAQPPFDTECPLEGRYAIWKRVNADAEYELTRRIATSSRPADLVRSAIDECAARSGGAFRCQHVRRAVQRTAHLLRERGQLQAVVTAFARSPSAGLDVPLLERGPNWGLAAAREFARLAPSPT